MDGPVEIAPGVYGLGTERVNWYLVEDGGRLTAVDAGVPSLANGLEQEIAKIGFELSDVAALVLTHSDFDHTGVALRLRDAGARILIHEDDERTLAKPGAKGGDSNPRNIAPMLLRPGMWALIAHMATRGAAHPTRVDGVETFRDGNVLDVPGSPRVIHTPGHTPGHCALLFERRNALFVGDALCTWEMASGRRGPQLMARAFNVDTDQCLASLDAIQDAPAELVLPGHGEPWRGGAAEAVARARSLA